MKPNNLSITKIESSFAGGANLEILGKGFLEGKNIKLNKVKVCGINCDINFNEFDKLICKTPPLLTPNT